MSETQSETDARSAGGGVVISHQPILDLSHLTSPEELATIARVEHVATAIVPESLAAAWTAIPAAHVAATVYVPGGQHARVHTGTLIVGGTGLGAADDVLVVVGLLVVTSPVTGPVPTRIHVVGSVLAPRGSEGALGQALAGGSGAVSYYPYAEGQDFKVLSGQVGLSAATLANAGGSPDDALIVAGQVTITGEVTTIGYRTVLIAGQLLAPAAARDTIEPAVHLQGQVVWYEGTKPRVFNGDASLGPDFFCLLSGPAALVVLGDLAISAGVTETMLGEKLTGITVFGDVTAPAALVRAVQARYSCGPGSTGTRWPGGRRTGSGRGCLPWPGTSASTARGTSGPRPERCARWPARQPRQARPPAPRSSPPSAPRPWPGPLPSSPSSSASPWPWPPRAG